MGDLTSLLNTLNLSPVNTILLAALVFILKGINQRLQTVEEVTLRNSNSIAFIKGKLSIEEEDDE